MEAATDNGLQCPVCQRWGFSSQSIIGHVGFCIEKDNQRNHTTSSNIQTKPSSKPSKKQSLNNNVGQGQKGTYQGTLYWGPTIIDVDHTSDGEDDNDDDFIENPRPKKKKTTTGTHGSSSSLSIGIGKENRPYQQQPHIIDLVNATGFSVDNNHRQQDRNTNRRVGMMGATVRPSNIQQPTTINPNTINDVSLSLQQNIEHMALRTMVIISNNNSFLFFPNLNPNNPTKLQPHLLYRHSSRDLLLAPQRYVRWECYPKDPKESHILCASAPLLDHVHM